MNYFLLKLIPPRPTFVQDMTEQERKTMHEHVAYWSALAAQRVAIVFGPVADPAGAWGVAIVELHDPPAVQQLVDEDPVVKANTVFRMEILPMPQAIFRS